MGFKCSTITGVDLPDFLVESGSTVLHKNHLRLKGDPLVEPVTLLETVSPHYARIKFMNGRIDTVSTRHLAPCATPHIKEIIQPPETFETSISPKEDGSTATNVSNNFETDENNLILPTDYHPLSATNNLPSPNKTTTITNITPSLTQYPDVTTTQNLLVKNSRPHRIRRPPSKLNL
nr:uncharacterized protein LOC124811472 [Hydra vulgaris]